jgi:hypothetical protein
MASHLQESVRSAQKLVQEVRGVPFEGTVQSALLPEKSLPALLEKKLVEDLPTSFDRYAATLVAVGLIEPTPDLLKRLVRLYSRQVAGFYDPAERKFYVVPERSAETAAQVPELGIGTGGDLMEEALLTHELTHALQDRRLDLDRRLKSLKSSTDALLALEAFLEGEATVVMMQAVVARLPEETRGLLGGSAFSELLAGLASGSANVEGAEGVPEFFVQELLFPYVSGAAWIEKRRASGGWAAVDEAYRHLPTSTSQILHPDRAPDARPLASGDVPKAKDIPAGGRELYTDTLGEWTLRMLLERAGSPESERLAAHRTDDRILFFETGEGRAESVGFQWRIRCSSPPAAKALAEALAPAYSGRPAAARPAITASGDVVEVSRGARSATPVPGA